MASIPEMTVVLEKKIEDARRFYEVIKINIIIIIKRFLNTLLPPIKVRVHTQLSLGFTRN